MVQMALVQETHVPLLQNPDELHPMLKMVQEQVLVP
jgi:hypothetical protein